MSSREYWKNRETEAKNRNVLEEAEYNRRIQEIYETMLDEITKEINGFYARYAKKEGITMAEARRRAEKLDIEAYARKAKKYVAEKDFSDVANEEMRIYNLTMKVNRLELLKANIGLEMAAGFDDLQKYFDKKLTKRTLDEFRRQAGILGKSVMQNEKYAHAIVNASFKSATYSDRIWMYQGMLKSEIEGLLISGLIRGQNPRKLARHLTKRFGVSASNAERLMSTELSRVRTEAQKQSFMRNGFDEYEFIACTNKDVCSLCRGLDGEHFKVEDMAPGENAPPMHPSCHCSVAAYMDDESYNKWLDSYQKHGLSYEEWKKTRIESSNNEINLESNIPKEMKRARFKTENWTDSSDYLAGKRERNFFGMPQDITREWTASSKEGKVSEMREYKVNGESYKVDGKRILLDYSTHEKEIAKIIAKESGRNIQLVPRITFPQGIQTPDYLIDGMRYDLKTPIGNGKNTIYGMVKSKKKQSNNFVICADDTLLSNEELERQINDLYKSKHTSFIDSIVLIRENKILKVYSRKK